MKGRVSVTKSCLSGGKQHFEANESNSASKLEQTCVIGHSVLCRVLSSFVLKLLECLCFLPSFLILTCFFRFQVWTLACFIDRLLVFALFYAGFTQRLLVPNSDLLPPFDRPWPMSDICICTCWNFAGTWDNHRRDLAMQPVKMGYNSIHLQACSSAPWCDACSWMEGCRREQNPKLSWSLLRHFEDCKNIVELLFSARIVPGTDLSGTPTNYGARWRLAGWL